MSINQFGGARPLIGINVAKIFIESTNFCHLIRAGYRLWTVLNLFIIWKYYLVYSLFSFVSYRISISLEFSLALILLSSKAFILVNWRWIEACSNFCTLGPLCRTSSFTSIFCFLKLYNRNSKQIFGWQPHITVFAIKLSLFWYKFYWVNRWVKITSIDLPVYHMPDNPIVMTGTK